MVTNCSDVQQLLSIILHVDAESHFSLSDDAVASGSGTDRPLPWEPSPPSFIAYNPCLPADFELLLVRAWQGIVQPKTTHQGSPSSRSSASLTVFFVYDLCCCFVIVKPLPLPPQPNYSLTDRRQQGKTLRTDSHRKNRFSRYCPFGLWNSSKPYLP